MRVRQRTRNYDFIGSHSFLQSSPTVRYRTLPTPCQYQLETCGTQPSNSQILVLPPELITAFMDLPWSMSPLVRFYPERKVVTHVRSFWPGQWRKANETCHGLRAEAQGPSRKGMDKQPPSYCRSSFAFLDRDTVLSGQCYELSTYSP